MSSGNIDAVISQCVEDIWKEYDTDKNGTLDKEEARSFINKTLLAMEGPEKADYTDEDFAACFAEFDKDKSGTIDKGEMAQFIKKVAGL